MTKKINFIFHLLSSLAATNFSFSVANVFLDEDKPGRRPQPGYHPVSRHAGPGMSLTTGLAKWEHVLSGSGLHLRALVDGLPISAREGFSFLLFQF